MSIPVSFYTATENGLVKDDDWMIDNDYEEIYNGGEGRTAGDNYQIYSGSLETSSHPKEKPIINISDVKVGDYLTDHSDTDMQMCTMTFYKVIKASKTTLTISKFIHDSDQMHKPVRLTYKTWSFGKGYWSNKRYRICLDRFVSQEDIIIHPAMKPC
jgi:hypothetical protein